MIKWQKGFSGLSKVTEFGWALALTNSANAAQTKNPLSRSDARLLKVRSVSSAGQYLDTIRQTRLALLSEGAAPFNHFKSNLV